MVVDRINPKSQTTNARLAYSSSIPQGEINGNDTRQIFSEQLALLQNARAVRRPQIPGSDDPLRIIGREIDGQVTPKRLIAEGGMAYVYLVSVGNNEAEVPNLFALKVFKDKVSRNKDGVDDTEYRLRKLKMVLDSIGLGNDLERLHLLPIYRFGESNGRMFALAKYVPSEITAEYFIEEKIPLTLQQSLLIGMQVCCALNELHRRNSIHRDIKPGNLLLDISNGDLNVLVADCDLMKKTDASRVLTAHDVYAGTDRYMAPEQALDDLGRIGEKELSGLADIYALLLTIKNLMNYESSKGSDQSALVDRILGDFIDSTKLRENDLFRDLPIGFQTLFEVATRKSPYLRVIKSASELSSEFQDILLDRNPLESNGIDVSFNGDNAERVLNLDEILGVQAYGIWKQGSEQADLVEALGRNLLHEIMTLGTLNGMTLSDDDFIWLENVRRNEEHLPLSYTELRELVVGKYYTGAYREYLQSIQETLPRIARDLAKHLLYKKLQEAFRDNPQELASARDFLLTPVAAERSDREDKYYGWARSLFLHNPQSANKILMYTREGLHYFSVTLNRLIREGELEGPLEDHDGFIRQMYSWIVESPEEFPHRIKALQKVVEEKQLQLNGSENIALTLLDEIENNVRKLFNEKDCVDDPEIENHTRIGGICNDVAKEVVDICRSIKENEMAFVTEKTAIERAKQIRMIGRKAFVITSGVIVAALPIIGIVSHNRSVAEKRISAVYKQFPFLKRDTLSMTSLESRYKEYLISARRQMESLSMPKVEPDYNGDGKLFLIRNPEQSPKLQKCIGFLNDNFLGFITACFTPEITKETVKFLQLDPKLRQELPKNVLYNYERLCLVLRTGPEDKNALRSAVQDLYKSLKEELLSDSNNKEKSSLYYRLSPSLLNLIAIYTGNIVGVPEGSIHDLPLIREDLSRAFTPDEWFYPCGPLKGERDDKKNYLQKVLGVNVLDPQFRLVGGVISQHIYPAYNKRKRENLQESKMLCSLILSRITKKVGKQESVKDVLINDFLRSKEITAAQDLLSEVENDNVDPKSFNQNHIFLNLQKRWHRLELSLNALARCQAGLENLISINEKVSLSLPN